MEIKSVCEGINLYMIPDDKFKNFKANIYIHTPLTGEDAAKNALLANVLASGTRDYPSKRSISRQLESLYGASMASEVFKAGESHVLLFGMDAITDKYIMGDDVCEEALTLLFDLLLNPLLDGDGFDKSIVDREKEVLKSEIQSVINDKRMYALIRCIEEMCAGKPYAVRRQGRVEDVDLLDEKSLYRHYQGVIANNPIDIIVSGNFDLDRVREFVTGKAKELKDRKGEYPVTTAHTAGKIKYITDKEQVSQGKLVIGYRAELDTQGDDYYTLLVYNAILGGGPASKLFNNVRERESLCYYASTRVEREKGMILAQAGVDFENYQKTLDAILKEGNDIAEGNFTENEFGNAVSTIVNSLLSYKDDLFVLSEYYGRQLSYKRMTGIDEAVEKIKSVKPEQIKKRCTSNKSRHGIFFGRQQGGGAK